MDVGERGKEKTQGKENIWKFNELKILHFASTEEQHWCASYDPRVSVIMLSKSKISLAAVFTKNRW